jgi:Ca2+-transporting ATPase
MQEGSFCCWELERLREHFRSDFEVGLTSAEAKSRLNKFGKNSLEKIKGISTLTIFIRQFYNFFIILLAIAAITSLFIEGLTHSVIFIVIIAVNITIGFFQEFKAERALDALKRNFSYKAKVVREGRILEIDSEDLVVGDLVVLSEGDKVPADLRLMEEDGLRVDESMLTGESLPVSKKIINLLPDTALADQVNMAFLGTAVKAGGARGLVVATGRASEIGKVAEMVEEEDERTPLELMILYIAKTLTILVGIVALIIFLIGLWQQYQVFELLTFVISLLVAAVPESLPTVVTLTLAVGVMAMVKKKVITRRLSVIEALGQVNMIITDKTGTLTENKLKITEFARITKGKIDSNRKGKKYTDALFWATICSSASGEKAGQFVGDPLEVAIIEELYNVGRREFGRRSEFIESARQPFNSDKKYMSVGGIIGSKKVIVVKGALDRVIKFTKLTKDELENAHFVSLAMSKKGFKAIAVLKKEIKPGHSSELTNMDLIGIIGFSDQPGEGVSEAIAQTISAGVKPVIVTGDHPEAAKYIAEKIGLVVAADELITVEKLEKMSDGELEGVLAKIKIFARVTPADKNRIVEAYTKAGFVVAVTGDGVNDAPALKTAAVGIAMGIKGNDVAREAADLVLTDDKYGSIVSAIIYGRTIYDNIKNALIFMLASNFAELFLVLIAFIFSLPLPLLAIQILWVNLITDSLPAIALAFEKPSRGVLKQPPREGSKSTVRHFIKISLILGVISLIVCFGLYLFGLEESVIKARTLVFALIVFSALTMVISIRSKELFYKSFRGLFENWYLNIAVIIAIALQIVVFLPGAREFFGTTVLNLIDVLVLAAGIMVIFLSTEVVKFKFLIKRISGV